MTVLSFTRGRTHLPLVSLGSVTERKFLCFARSVSLGCVSHPPPRLSSIPPSECSDTGFIFRRPSISFSGAVFPFLLRLLPSRPLPTLGMFLSPLMSSSRAYLCSCSLASRWACSLWSSAPSLQLRYLSIASPRSFKALNFSRTREPSYPLRLHHLPRSHLRQVKRPKCQLSRVMLC